MDRQTRLLRQAKNLRTKARRAWKRREGSERINNLLFQAEELEVRAGVLDRVRVRR